MVFSIIFSLFFYSMAGVLVNLIVKGAQDAPYPFDEESLGIITIWPFFAFKLVLLVWIWLTKNFASSLGGAIKNLTGRKY